MHSNISKLTADSDDIQENTRQSGSFKKHNSLRLFSGGRKGNEKSPKNVTVQSLMPKTGEFESSKEFIQFTLLKRKAIQYVLEYIQNATSSKIEVTDYLQ